jgi:hypothetical protein
VASEADAFAEGEGESVGGTGEVEEKGMALRREALDLP